MDKCAICGKETEDLFECDMCGRLVCADCGVVCFICLDCLELNEKED